MSIPYPIGHADFYPAYGKQPGCEKKNYQGSINYLEIPQIKFVSVFLNIGFCSHSRAHHLFVESLNHNCFLATKCGSYEEIKNKNCTSSGPNAYMGGEVDQLLQASEGIYYLPTNPDPPYGMNCSSIGNSS